MFSCENPRLGTDQLPAIDICNDPRAMRSPESLLIDNILNPGLNSGQNQGPTMDR
jgi:hypothetical protein